MSDETYTMLYHRFVDSPAGRLLSMGGFAVLFDFRRKWERATRNGKRRCHSISFTWSKSPRHVSRSTWTGYRAELVGKGFIDKVTESGYYRQSERWQTYEPTDDEICEQRKQREAKRKRARNTAEYRAQKLGLRDRASDLDPGEEVSNVDPGGRVQNRDPGTGSQNRTLSITKDISIPPLYPPSELQNRSNGVSSEGDIFDEFPTEERSDAG